ncbi:protein GAMETE EXPRESSED 3 isoform X1 [Arachis stenosperma]|uniref:protein GAMETE EXPRESSED 3 isoform X1 n=1 Tax=Arachis stenosperma TaxID=217475 RepID=UPI0025AD8EF4|nr:protein GAMETE EXPRESSED 3 isoform X1 [Arachis stenosperma]
MAVTMPMIHLLIFVFALATLSPSSAYDRLSKPLVGDDGRIYVCSNKKLFAFESNGSISWTMHIDYKCNVAVAPVHGGFGKIYLIADNRILMVKLENSGTSEPVAELFFGPGPGQQVETEIIGLSVSTLTSTVFINIKNRGLFAYKSHGRLLWSIGPVLYKFGYHQGCRKNITDCSFASVPVLDQCEGSIYISNTEGQLYCLSIRGRHFRWIQDFSYLDRNFTITAGNNGRLYVTVPVRALLLAVDVFSGNVLWQRSIGPLSKADSVPVVDSNGWVSIGSLDGFLYSFSPTGDLKKFSRRNTDNYVIQVGSFLDCSGFAVYTSQIEMEGKVSHTAGEFTTVSAIRPKVALLTMLVPATGSIYWSENNPGQLTTSLSKSDLSQFLVDEEILLAFLAASKTGNLLQCRTTGQKLASSCSQARTKLVSIYTGNERVIALFLLFESTVLAILIGLVRFCCSFWAKKKLQDQGLGSFLAKRCSLQLKKKALDRTITELERKATEEAADREVLDKLVDMSKEREGIQRKLSTTYSLGRDKSDSHARSILPLQTGKTKSYSFQGTRGKNMTMFHTMSDTSSSESSYEGETSMLGNKDSSTKAKTKALMMEDSPSSSSSSS